MEKIAEALGEKVGRHRVLYDKWYTPEFARPRLDTYVSDLYHNDSGLIVSSFVRSTAKKSGVVSNGTLAAT